MKPAGGIQHQNKQPTGFDAQLAVQVYKHFSLVVNTQIHTDRQKAFDQLYYSQLS